MKRKLRFMGCLYPDTDRAVYVRRDTLTDTKYYAMRAEFWARARRVVK
jgi:hypothetical protein